ncbi:MULTISPECIES: TetR/AcrR family transcriptional regulator [Brevibacillus]|uniref:TetR/AcrR family transcriptional regulator n=1 Tax=Brevibacillus porteri TaxID=2126350 RepID=A0ABX5FWP5_9BACL|nr:MULTISPECIES: TetR family transcriptional regulator [Brevibacillus]MDC0761026.1 TetR family transcriptional regulator [Brevibacillus sp. AG]MED1797400.1 TetR family transcriptional regulator [Brevibacillus porteri]MED2129470.1 TetR family transcriptional regulator [Brevibacillus porteri]MED2747607.1 TetR family transcriptional regulator [Brevibacillus porteri]MED2817983.1 TetR family transcriptional regulator [Brevibacillus porteri]
MNEDVRVYKTKKSIASALVSLLKEKDFSQITIKDICTRSLTSKSTFYSHYTDKYDLLEKMVKYQADFFQKEMARRFVSIQRGNVAKVIEMIIDLTAANKTEIATLLNVHVPSADLSKEVELILYHACYSYLDKALSSPTVSVDYLAKLYVANAMVLLNWTLQNEKDMGAIQLASTMQQYIFEWVQNGHPSIGTHS